MKNRYQCLHCGRYVAEANTQCEQCDSNGKAPRVSTAQPTVSKPDRQAMMLFWFVSVLFVSGIVVGLTMLLPHMLK